MKFRLISFKMFLKPFIYIYYYSFKTTSGFERVLMNSHDFLRINEYWRGYIYHPQTGRSSLGQIHNIKTIIQALFKTNILKSANREWSLNCPKCTKAYAHLFLTHALEFPNANREWKEKYNNEHVKCFINERTQPAWEENELRLLSVENSVANPKCETWKTAPDK